MGKLFLHRKTGGGGQVRKGGRDYFDGNAAFTGKVFFNRQVMNGADPSTHNIAILQPSVSAWKKELQKPNDPKFQALANYLLKMRSRWMKLADPC